METRARPHEGGGRVALSEAEEEVHLGRFDCGTLTKKTWAQWCGGARIARGCFVD